MRDRIRLVIQPAGGEGRGDSGGVNMRHRIAFTSYGYNWWYTFTHPWELVAWLWQELRCFVQRGLYGWSYRDRWSLDGYLSRWLPGALEGLEKYGSPGNISVEEWAAILTAMQRGFEAHWKLINWDWDNATEGRVLEDARDAALALFAQWFGALWE